MAVRYVVLTERVAPGSDDGGPSPFAPALAEQLDLRELQSQAGAHLYENSAWVPGDAIVAGRIGTGPSGAPLGASTGRIGDRGSAAGTVLWSQQYDDAWEASSSAGSLPHRRSFGWANAFTARGSGPITVSFGDQWWRWPVLAGELVIVALIGRRIVRRGRRRGRLRTEPDGVSLDAPSKAT
jgi:hypothetical protein